MLALFACNARADWLDEMPSVTAVSEAAHEELKVDAQRWKRPDAVRDEDNIAVSLVGTLTLLRQILFLKYNDEPPMSPEREAKLKEIYAAYSEAELVIGQGASGRRGYITRDPGRGCRDAACYRRWFENDSSNVRIRAEYRGRVLPRLFPCGGRAKELYDLYQRHAVDVPHLPSPAVTGRVEPEVAGIAPAGCAAFGGDANRNGLCDDWEKIAQSATPPSGATKSVGIRMLSLKTNHLTPVGGVRVTIAPDSAMPGTTACFRLLRADRPALGAGTEIWQGVGRIEAGADPAAPLHAMLADKVSLEVDAKKPFLLLEVTSAPSYGAVSCEQPLPTWEQRHRRPAPNGWHGPYPRTDVAVVPAGEIALGMTADMECGFAIGRDMRSPVAAYYVSPPICGAASTEFSEDEYRRSMLQGIERSCREITDFALVSYVHTHPESPVPAIDKRNDYFSTQDFNQAILQKKQDTLYEKSYMVSKGSRCIEGFVPRADDEELDFIDRYVFGVAGQIPAFAPQYLKYIGRMETLRCF